MLSEAIAGRIMFRQTGDNATILVGVLTLPAHVHIIEGALYLMVLWGNRVAIAHQALDDGVPARKGAYGIDGLLHEPLWRSTSAPGTLCVRFIKAFPEDNVWSVFGPSKTPLLPSAAFQRGHAWCDIVDGAMVPIDAPIDATGKGISSPLTSYAIWPGPAGNFYCMPQAFAEHRPAFLRHRKLLASLGRGEMEQAQYVSAVRADKGLRDIAPYGTPESEYLQFLVTLDAEGGLTEDAPIECNAHAAHTRRVSDIVAAQLKRAA